MLDLANIGTTNSCVTLRVHGHLAKKEMKAEKQGGSNLQPL